MNDDEERCQGAPGNQRRRIRMAKIAIAGLIGAFVLFYIITSPDQAANMVHGAWHGAVNVAHGVGHFFDKLAS